MAMYVRVWQFQASSLADRNERQRQASAPALGNALLMGYSNASGSSEGCLLRLRVLPLFESHHSKWVCPWLLFIISAASPKHSLGLIKNYQVVPGRTKNLQTTKRRGRRRLRPALVQIRCSGSRDPWLSQVWSHELLMLHRPCRSIYQHALPRQLG